MEGKSCIKTLTSNIKRKVGIPVLQQMAKMRRRNRKAIVLAITGTNGKTTTKELTNAVLSKNYRTICTQGNYNNHVGVPLTLLQIRQDTEIAIVEMGANHPGEIAFLCKIAKPDYGMITNIGKAHLEGFGSIEGVKKTKKELFDHLKTHGGKAFVNGDNTMLMDLSEGMERTTYGAGTENDCVASLVSCSPFLRVNATGTGDIQTCLVGEYNFENVAAAIAIGKYFKVSDADIKAAIEDYTPTNSRSQVINTKKSNRVVLDAYNANPVSMKASVTSFRNSCGDNPLLILGDMLELGDASDEEHQSIIKLINSLGFNEIYLVGDCMGKAVPKEDKRYTTYKDINELKKQIEANPLSNRNILIKGSHGIHLEEIMDYL